MAEAPPGPTLAPLTVSEPMVKGSALGSAIANVAGQGVHESAGQSREIRSVTPSSSTADSQSAPAPQTQTSVTADEGAAEILSDYGVASHSAPSPAPAPVELPQGQMTLKQLSAAVQHVADDRYTALNEAAVETADEDIEEFDPGNFLRENVPQQLNSPHALVAKVLSKMRGSQPSP